jgi:2-oxoglutarate dehydrogenase E2 component (dihydrolipoamide succinyltransferase)
MSVSVEVPSLGESVTEGYIAEWKKKEGDYVREDEIILELETDKITITVPSPVSGTITSLKGEVDDAVAVGTVIAEIEPGEDTGATAGGGEDKAEKAEAAPEEAAAKKASEEPAEKKEAAEKAPSKEADGEKAEPQEHEGLSPAVSRLVEENDLDPSKIEATGPNGRLLKGDVLAHLEKPQGAGITVDRAPQGPTSTNGQAGGEPREERVKMSRLRQTIARRLVEAQQTAAMLTTFQEADMSGIMRLRKQYKQQFIDRYDVKLGFMSFFVKAAVEVLKEFPAVNAEIDGNELVYKNYYNIGVAIGGGEKGLVVPVIRDADQLGFAEVELYINDLVKKVMDNSLSLDDLQGGTFSITNGGIYGSMLSTPILNPPQSGILGMHNIIERPVAVDGKVEIRPMMYLALSYDHRVIDGREAVTFLKRLAELLEDPERILLEI